MKMGAPYFQIKGVLRRHGIQAFSSNFGLSRAGYELINAGDFLDA
ncbi:RulB protein [Pseudomonas savastanoi]|nr:RulB protein [Pseudomonas savastanoi]